MFLPQQVTQDMPPELLGKLRQCTDGEFKVTDEVVNRAGKILLKLEVRCRSPHKAFRISKELGAWTPPRIEGTRTIRILRGEKELSFFTSEITPCNGSDSTPT